MTIYEFINANISFVRFSVVMLFIVIFAILFMVYTMYRKKLMSKNILKHGWPPGYIDAEGNLGYQFDFRKDNKKKIPDDIMEGEGP